MKRLMFAVLAAALVGCQQSGTAIKQDDSNIIVRGNVGDAYTFLVSSKIEAVGAKGSVTFTGTMSERLANVEGDTFSWETIITDVQAEDEGVMKGAAEVFMLMKDVTIVSEQDSRGVVKSLRSGNDVMPSEGSSNVVLPPKGAKVGDTWPAKVDLTGTIVDITYTLEGFEEVDGVRAAKIVGTFAEDSAAKSIEPTVFFVEVSNGKLVLGTSVTEVTSQGWTVRITNEIKRNMKG